MCDFKKITDKFRRGDHKSFRIIFNEIYPSLTLYALSYIKNKDDAEDIVQRAFIMLWEERKNFDSMKAIKSYLYKIVRNSALNIIKHNTIKDKHSNLLLDEYELNYNPEKDIIRNEVYNQVLEVFDELPSACKQVYSMSLSGMKHQEISEKLNITVNTVKKQKNRANKYLKEKLKDVFSLLF